jgi:hypothetical protein
MLWLLPLHGKAYPAVDRTETDHLDEYCPVRHYALWGTDAKLMAPHVLAQCLNDALLLELNYLKEDLTSSVGDRSDKAFIHNAHAVLTACRILIRPIMEYWLPRTKRTTRRWRQFRYVAGDHSSNRMKYAFDLQAETNSELEFSRCIGAHGTGI